MCEHMSTAHRHKILHLKFLKALLIQIYLFVVPTYSVSLAAHDGAGSPVNEMFTGYLYLAICNTLFYFVGTFFC